VDPTNALMVGNSLRSDIIPPLEIGSYAVLIPNQDEWIYENEGQVPTHSKRFFEIKNISELPKTVKKIVESL
ncbi:MAG: HAD family hydrolase, partial [Rhodobacteraceae bacterium]|nr:HAD family hydrolase [Paracoccaceae bacterium]